MADFSALKTSIQNYIKQNGNEEITGNLLQQILLSMVTTLGDSAINDLVTALNAEIANRGNADTTLQGNINSEATTRANADTELGGRITTLQGVVNGILANIGNGYVYAGIATPSTTPASGKVFYLALTAGTYTNFGATVVPQGINILKYNGSTWSLDTFIALDDAPTQGSSNLVKSGGVFNSIKENTKDLKDAIRTDENKDCFYITDYLGNIIGKFDNNGLSVTDVLVLKNNILTSILTLLSDNNFTDALKAKLEGIENNATRNANILSDSESALYISDGNGNIIAQFSNKGIKAISPMNSLGAAKIVGIGDSLSTHGYGELAEMAGGADIQGYSEGGTFSIPNGNNSTQDRVKKFIEDDTAADVVILENINDGWYSYNREGGTLVKKGNITDEPFMVSQYITHENNYNTEEEAIAGFETNFATIVAGVTNKKKGTVCRIKYTTQKILLTVTGSASSNGELTITLGNETYVTPITNGMTANQIASAINVHNFVGYTHSVSNNIVTLVLQAGYTLDTPNITNTATGVSVNNSTDSANGYVNEYFLKYTSEEFAVLGNWSVNVPTLYSLYKGIFEYLQSNRPQLRVVFFAPTAWALDFNNPPSNMTNSDGSWNYSKIMETEFFKRNKLLREIQKDVSLFYGCEFVDAMDGCGITPFNAETYYNNYDVHPKNLTYGVWAEYLYKMLK